MKKKLSIEEIENSVNKLDGVDKKETKKSLETKTPISFKKKRRRKVRRIIITSIIGTILVTLGFFGVMIYRSLDSIFANEGLPGLLGLLDSKPLKGESSGRVNILILGVGDEGHAGSTLSDTNIVMSLNTRTSQVSMLSIPRDLYVKIEGNGYDKINAAHAFGEKAKEGTGPEIASKTISEVVGVPIHYYVRVDFTGFEKIIDAVGGIDIYVDQDLYDPYYPIESGRNGKRVVSFKKGFQHMDGNTALKYARSRYTTSDFDRAKRQQKVILAVKEKVLSTETLLNPKKIIEISKAIGDHIKTDFQTNEFQRVIELSKKMDTANAISIVLDNSETGLLIDKNISGGYYLVPRKGTGNYSEIQSLMANIFSADLKIKQEAAKVAIYNATDRSGLASTVAEKLREAGFEVVYVGSSSKKITASIIYDYTAGQKKESISWLKTNLKVTNVQTSSTYSKYDLEIYLGPDYQGQ